MNKPSGCQHGSDSGSHWVGDLFEGDDGIVRCRECRAEFVPTIRLVALTEAATKAAAELRHAYGGSHPVAPMSSDNWRSMDGNLVSKAINILETAVSASAPPATKESEPG